jgi:hypothetical protein
MEPSRLDLARLDLQAAVNAYLSDVSSLEGPPPSPDRLLLALTDALGTVINELNDLRKGR